MPICIECRHPVKTLWREGAGDKAGGHNIRLTVCKNCGRFCDKYVEHDFVILFIDLVLIKPQVWLAPAEDERWAPPCATWRAEQASWTEEGLTTLVLRYTGTCYTIP